MCPKTLYCYECNFHFYARKTFEITTFRLRAYDNITKTSTRPKSKNRSSTASLSIKQSMFLCEETSWNLYTYFPSPCYCRPNKTGILIYRLCKVRSIPTSIRLCRYRIRRARCFFHSKLSVVRRVFVFEIEIYTYRRQTIFHTDRFIRVSFEHASRSRGSHLQENRVNSSS